MADYDFKALNDEDFEILTSDLLSAELGFRFHRFKKGKDKGIDGRYFSPDDGVVIFQCKHWAGSSFNTLLSSLRNSELPKVKLLKPKRYILVTSQALSATNKSEIRAIFEPYILEDNDVYGKEALNDLLRNHQNILQNHFKLWLHSAEMLDLFANSAILGRSKFTINEIVEKSTQYVPTKNHLKSIELLNKNNVIIITGEPGIGKTTLAEQLSLHYVTQGFQLCVGANSVEELEGFYKNQQKQIFYFDDFLGRNFLEALERHEDSHIVGFIKRVSKDATKRFVLTSRTTVLNRGKSLSELFVHQKVDRHEFELEVKSLSNMDKARILHSCIWYSGLKKEFIEVIVSERRYLEIINHQNFNPRIVSFITDPLRLDGVTVENYWDYLTGKLENPEDIWEHVVFRQLDDFSRSILLLVVYEGNLISEADLIASFHRLLNDPFLSRFRGDQDFDNSIQLLVGSVLNRTIYKSGETFYDLFNPSIADYVIKRFSSEVPLQIAHYKALNSERSMRSYEALLKDEFVSEKTSKHVFQELITSASLDEADKDYKKWFSVVFNIGLELGITDNESIKRVKAFLLSSVESKARYSYLPSLCNGYIKLFQQGQITISELENFVLNLDLGEIGDDDLYTVSLLRPLLQSGFGDDFEEQLKPVIVESLSDSIHEDIVHRDVLGEFFYDEESAEAEKVLYREVEDLLSQYPLKFDRYDVEDIIKYCDVDDIIQSNRERASEDYEDDSSRTAQNSSAEIDDLFSFDLPNN